MKVATLFCVGIAVGIGLTLAAGIILLHGLGLI